MKVALAHVDNKIAVFYRGITIYHLYERDCKNQKVMEYCFTLDPSGQETNPESFDIRQIKEYDVNTTPAANLVQMINRGVFGEVNLQKKGLGNSDDFYDGKMCKAGYCPVCGAEIQNYNTYEVYDSHIEYPFTCSNCKVSGAECANLVFCGYSIE